MAKNARQIWKTDKSDMAKNARQIWKSDMADYGRYEAPPSGYFSTTRRQRGSESSRQMLCRSTRKAQNVMRTTQRTTRTGQHAAIRNGHNQQVHILGLSCSVLKNKLRRSPRFAKSLVEKNCGGRFWISVTGTAQTDVIHRTMTSEVYSWHYDGIYCYPIQNYQVRLPRCVCHPIQNHQCKTSS